MSSAFAQRLREAGGRLARVDADGSVAEAAAEDVNRAGPWCFVGYDQLHAELFEETCGLASAPEACGLVVVECPDKGGRRPYHKQKLATVLANLRHFAVEQAARGATVVHLSGPGDYADLLRAWCHAGGRSLHGIEPAELEMRTELQPLRDEGLLEWRTHPGWLSTPEQFDEACAKRPYRMDAFYRSVRRAHGWLIEDEKPVGGKWSFDAENRKPWKGEPPAPELPQFPRDPIKEEVGALVAERFGDHPGQLDLDRLAATAEDAEAAWSWALEHCLEHFGPYEDAMSTRSSGLFHTRIAPLLNVHRILPRRVVEDVLASDAPLACREGFLRQVAGWREFVRHVHRATDGFAEGVDDSGVALPQAYWGATPSGMRCLDTVVGEVWREGYSHHITRLMVLGNLATLLDFSARELSDWFRVAYADAYDWVVEPNVLGMATWATAGLMTTKPYVSGANYIHKMSDYCDDCQFHWKQTCPVTPLYWAWLARHAESLEGNPRMNMPLASLRKRSADQRSADAATFERVRTALGRGETLTV